MAFQVADSVTGEQLRSGPSINRSFIRFLNLTSKLVDVYWLDYQGTPVSYATLNPLGYFDVNTFENHPWIFRTHDTGEETNHFKFTATPEVLSRMWRAILIKTPLHRLSWPQLTMATSFSTDTSADAKWLDLKTTSFHSAIEVAARVLRNDGVIALPTDTIYGLAASVKNTEKIYQIKGRSATKPVALCFADVADIYGHADIQISHELLCQLLPGPVTLVFRRTTGSEEAGSLGVRVPDHQFTRAVCRAVGEPLSLTSANVSAASSALVTQEFADLWPSLSLIVDGGEIVGRRRVGSTVVDLTAEGCYRILRTGCASVDTERLLLEAGLKETVCGDL